LHKTFAQSSWKNLFHVLQSYDLDVVVAALDDHHLHILARFPDRNPRHHLGRVKKHTSHILREMRGIISDGGIWSKRSKCIPIRDRAHQVNAARYILAHKERGAAVWRIKSATKAATTQ